MSRDDGFLIARPTVYDGIAMRSRLEARFAALWDRLGWSWEYEPRVYASRSGQYLPDFVILDDQCPGGCEHGSLFVEVKGTLASLDELRALQLRMEVILASEPDADLEIIVDRPRLWSINLGGPGQGWTAPQRWPEAWEGVTI